METFTNAELVRNLQQSNDAVFAYIYDKFHNAVFANICSLVSNDTEAEDILQDVFVLLWTKRLTLNSKQEIGGWLFSTSYYKSMAFLRQSIKQRVAEFEEGAFDISSDIESPDDCEVVYKGKLTILNDGIALLSPQKKSAFTLCRVQGKSYEEAANLLGLSSETVRGYVKDSLVFLKRYARTNALLLSAYTLCCFISFCKAAI